MKKYLLLIIFITTISAAYAQFPEDALKLSWYTQQGTARNVATGGVMGSLGGDITANHVNPAGLGLFKTNEFVISPGFILNKNKFRYRGTDTANDKNAINYGASGFIFGMPNNSKGSSLTSSAFAISINQLGSYNNKTYYKGLNTASSFSEQYLEELVRDRADTIAALQNYIFGSSLAFRTYLIDTANNESGVFNGYKTLAQNLPLNQERSENSRGGFHEIAVGGAANFEDKLYVGGSLTIPISLYSRELFYKESDATGNANNNFGYAEYREKLKSTAVGLGLKLGAIYKPQEYIRLGFAVHTPQIMSFKDEIRSWMTANTEGYAGTVSESSDNLNSGDAGKREYNMITPWRAMVSASYVFREVENTKRQRAFISADIEYVNHRGVRYMSRDDEDVVLKDYYKAVNSAIKDYYKGNFNFRLGGELKLHTWMFRLGGAYYGSPYAEKSFKANRILATGGLGYRNKGMFIDLGYSHAWVKDVNAPYRLNDQANTFAEQRGSRGNVVATIGFKF
jgi:long-subunit fatty acid transport protein